MTTGITEVVFAALELAERPNLGELRVHAMIQVMHRDDGGNPCLEGTDRVHGVEHQVQPATAVPLRTASIESRPAPRLAQDAILPEPGRVIPHPTGQLLPDERNAQLAYEIHESSRHDGVRPPTSNQGADRHVGLAPVQQDELVLELESPEHVQECHGVPEDAAVGARRLGVNTDAQPRCS